jgi:hypothetical protein
MEDYQRRVIEEAYELDRKIAKLDVFKRSDTFKALPADQAGLLEAQQRYMQQYSRVLWKRIQLWDLPPGEVVDTALNSQIAAPVAAQPAVTDEMVSRFLGWRLPDDFAPDGGVTFTRPLHPNNYPTGTNLFTATQAQKMLEHVIGATVASAEPSRNEPVANKDRETLMLAIVKTGQELGIIRDDLEAAGVTECLHILECVGKPAANTQPEKAGVSKAARDVLTERRRQVESLGYDYLHDDDHDKGELACAAAAYATSALMTVQGRRPRGPVCWPWGDASFKPGTARDDCVRAAALLLAEIERLDRAEAKS